MEIQIKHPNTSDKFLLEIDISKSEDQTVYKIRFMDKRLSTLYGDVIIKRNFNNFWKFPENVDSFLMSIISETIFQIMNNEITEE
jgi:hypothetical protein